MKPSRPHRAAGPPDGLIKFGYAAADFQSMVTAPVLGRPSARGPRWPFVAGLVLALAVVAATVAWPRYEAYAQDRATEDAAAFSAMVAHMPVPAGMREDPTLSSCLPFDIRCFEPTDDDVDAGFGAVCAALRSRGADLDCIAFDLPGVFRQSYGSYGRANVVLTSRLNPFVGESEWESVPGIGVSVHAGDTAADPYPSPAVLPSDLKELGLLPDAWTTGARCVEPVAGGCRQFKWQQRIDGVPADATHRLARRLDDAGLYVDHVRCKDDGSFCTVSAGGFLGPGGTESITVVVGFSRVGAHTRLHASVG